VAGGTCRSKPLAEVTCQRVERLTKQLCKGVKESWENTLLTNFQAVIHFSEMKRIYEGSA